MTQIQALTEFTNAPQPLRGNEGAPIIGPTNPTHEAQNPDTLVPPREDHGTLPNLRWSFADSHMHLTSGGWGRQTTARELPVSTELAGVSMRLKAGGVREMHWHKAAEWAFMLKGRARITAIDQDGRAFQDDVGEGTCGTSGPGSHTRFRASRATGASSCSSSTTATFRKRRPSCSPTGSPTLPKRFLPRTLACPRARSRTSRRRSSGSFRRRFPARSPRIGSPAPGRCV